MPIITIVLVHSYFCAYPIWAVMMRALVTTAHPAHPYAPTCPMPYHADYHVDLALSRDTKRAEARGYGILYARRSHPKRQRVFWL